MRRLPLQALWDKHLTDPFPVHLAGEEVEGLDVALLDAAAAACISYFLDRGELDLRRAATLGLCHRHLAVVARRLDGPAQDYFLRLEDLAYEVLQAVRDGAPEVA